MSLRKPKNKNSKKVIDHDERDHSTHTVSVMANNYYEVGPSGVHFTDCTVDMEVYNSPLTCPTKLPQLHSPPHVSTPISYLDNTLTADVGSWPLAADIPPLGNTSHLAQLSTEIADVPSLPVLYATIASTSAISASTALVSHYLELPLHNEASQNRKKKKVSSQLEVLKHCTLTWGYRNSQTKS